MTPEQLGPGDSLRGYRILRELAQGGFSRVFLVELEGCRYALKLATTPASPEDLDHVDGWVRREAVSLEHLAHENLLPVYELGRWPDPRTGYSFFVTEPVEGMTLHVWRRHTRASLHTWVGGLCKVLQALEHMHARRRPPRPQGRQRAGA
jgi:serine/threonine-protein kinase